MTSNLSVIREIKKMKVNNPKFKKYQSELIKILNKTMPTLKKKEKSANSELDRKTNIQKEIKKTNRIKFLVGEMSFILQMKSLKDKGII